MAHPILLQDWTTIRGNALATVVVQQEDSYADLLGYQDVGIYLDVSDFVNSPQLQFHTSPTKEDAFFSLMTGATVTPSFTGLQTPLVYVKYAAAAVPLARFVRWRASGAAALWSITFRVWLVGNPVRS